MVYNIWFLFWHSVNYTETIWGSVYRQIPLISSILDWILGAVIEFISLLPESPIQQFTASEEVQAVFGYINWFIPLGQISAIMGAILGATIIWYAVRWVLRFAKYVD